MILDGWLAQAAISFPDHVAIRCGDDEISYRELDQLAGAMAGELIARDVRPGDLVGIHLPKSIDAIIAIYGTLKAGAAYVPILPGSPPVRVQQLAGDCRMSVLIADTASLTALAAVDLASTLVLALERAGLEASGTTSITITTPDDALAYILYTSGSTGAPKGVMIGHDAAANFVRWAVDRFAITHTDRLANLAPLSFDLSIFDIFGAAKTGATLHLIAGDRAIFPAALSRYATEHELTVWYSVPSALARLPSHGALDKYPMSSLRCVLFAGEPFAPTQLAALIKALPEARFHNLYGPTETNVVAHHEVVASGGAEPVPIGRPCAGHEFAIVDPDGGLVPPDGAGELLVTGPSLMQGYYNSPESTEAAFAAFPGRPQARAYRTGDRVRCDAQGNWHFLGRLDDMIKTRGYRVEPAEIETVLLRHPQVEEAAVIAVPDEQLGNRLVALVFLTGDAANASLSSHCSAFLPSYMIPVEFIARPDPLPRTQTGKVDRAACRKTLEFVDRK